jgi:ferredoxin
VEREIIIIDEEKCTGCGLCIPNCPEGALQLIDGKARLISDLFCDGLGACIGHCPEDAISVEKREAEPYDERGVMENIVKQGDNVILAHLEHLKAHGELDLYDIACQVLEEKGLSPSPAGRDAAVHAHEMHDHVGCPGMAMTLEKGTAATPGQFQGKDLLLAADCVAYALGDFHRSYLKGKALAIACPKLDEGQEVYYEKLLALIDQSGISSLTVMTMEVPCCRGLLMLAQRAVEAAERKVPLTWVVVGVQGDILREEHLAS